MSNLWTTATLRLGVLALLCSGAAAVWVRVAIAPSEAYQPATTYTLPATVPLPQWQDQPMAPPPPPDIDHLLAANTYRYTQGDRTLTATVWYLANTDGEVATLLGTHSPHLAGLRIQPQVSDDSGNNTYGILVDPQDDTLHLTACIAAQGSSTLTAEQFQATRRWAQLSPRQWVEWAVGQRRIEDYRCLWTLFSLEGDRDETDPQLLADTWQDWHRWWQAHYPRR
jgi:cyanosortase A-associated protein